MKCASSRATFVAFRSVTHSAFLMMSFLAACGSDGFYPGKQDKSGDKPAALAGQKLGDCYSLGAGSGQGSPNQGSITPQGPNDPKGQIGSGRLREKWREWMNGEGPTGPGAPIPGTDLPPPNGSYDPKTGHGTDVVVIPPGQGKEPNPPPPGVNPPSGAPCTPGQTPGQMPMPPPSGKPGGPAYPEQPLPPPTTQPLPPGNPPPSGYPNFPSQQPPTANCGKGGQFCDDGGPGQWPPTTIGGKPYSQGEVQACIDAFHQNGYDTHGQWGIEVREINNVSVLSESTIVDRSLDYKIVIIHSVNVLSRMAFELLNPNALYCLNNVSVLDKVYVKSCYNGNVAYFGSNVRVLSKGANEVVPCP